MATIKKATFSIFREEQLPSINTQAGPSELRTWKSNPKVKQCYDKLFQNIESGGLTYMTQILEKVWPDFSKVHTTHVAYAISVCKTLLNPSIDDIQITSSIEKKIKKNIVSFTIF